MSRRSEEVLRSRERLRNGDKGRCEATVTKHPASRGERCSRTGIYVPLFAKVLCGKHELALERRMVAGRSLADQLHIDASIAAQRGRLDVESLRA